MKVVAFVRTSNIYDDSRSTKEIIALCEAGYKVVVLGWNRNGKANEKCEEVFGNYDVQFHFFERYLESGIGLKNIGLLFEWFRWEKKIIKEHKEINVVHACNLDSAISILGICKKRNIPIVYDIYDYYVDSHHIPGMLVNSVEKTEHKVINSSAATIICTEERIEQIKGSTPKEVVVIHNSPEIKEVISEELNYDYAYCGSLCGRRLIKEIIDEYKNNIDLKVVFAGNDSFYKDAETASRIYENFEFKGTVPYTQVLDLEAQSRIISAIYEPTIRNHRLCAPNKFYEALALSKPVIVCRGTGIDRIVDEFKIGIVIDYDACQFYEAINTLLSDEQLRIEMGKRARELYDEKYRWSIMSERLIGLYSRII